jgi:AcrR family transcriptional regulator
MAKTRTPKDSWTRAGLSALAEGGPDAVRIELLARSLGVSKGGFYWHFEDREELLGEMLESWERGGVDEVIAAVEDGEGDPKRRLRRLFEIASASAEERLRTELAIREWARHDEAVAARVARVDERRMDYMRPLFAPFCEDPAEVEARCFLAFSLFTASELIRAGHPGTTRPDVLERALGVLLA